MPKETNFHSKIAKVYRHDTVYQWLFGFIEGQRVTWGEGFAKANVQVITDNFMRHFNITDDDIPRETLIKKYYDIKNQLSDDK